MKYVNSWNSRILGNTATSAVSGTEWGGSGLTAWCLRESPRRTTGRVTVCALCLAAQPCPTLLPQGLSSLPSSPSKHLPAIQGQRRKRISLQSRGLPRSGSASSSRVSAGSGARACPVSRGPCLSRSLRAAVLFPGGVGEAWSGWAAVAIAAAPPPQIREAPSCWVT